METPGKTEGSRPSDKLEVLVEAFRIFEQTGECCLECDDCNGIIQLEALSDSAWRCNCKCGKYKDTLRGF